MQKQLGGKKRKRYRMPYNSYKKKKTNDSLMSAKFNGGVKKFNLLNSGSDSKSNRHSMRNFKGDSKFVQSDQKKKNGFNYQYFTTNKATIQSVMKSKEMHRLSMSHDNDRVLGLNFDSAKKPLNLQTKKMKRFVNEISSVENDESCNIDSEDELNRETGNYILWISSYCFHTDELVTPDKVKPTKAKKATIDSNPIRHSVTQSYLSKKFSKINGK